MDEIFKAKNNTTMIMIPKEAFEQILSRLEEIEKVIKETTKDKDELLDVETACRVMSVSERTLLKYRKKRKLPYIQIHKKVLFKKSDIDAFIEAHYIRTRA